MNQVVNKFVSFNKPFVTVPQVTANTLQDPAFASANDTFAVSLQSITKTGFTVHVRRVDTGGSSTGLQLPCFTWAQNLRLSWIAVGRLRK